MCMAALPDAEKRSVLATRSPTEVEAEVAAAISDLRGNGAAKQLSLASAMEVETLRAAVPCV